MNIPLSPETPDPNIDDPVLPIDEPAPIPEEDPPSRDPTPIGDPPNEDKPVKA